MEQIHQVPEKLKEKLKTEYSALLQLRAEMERLDGNIQNVIGAYILGAGIPANNVRFNDEYDILYDDGMQEAEIEQYEEEEEEASTMRVLSKKPKVR